MEDGRDREEGRETGGGARSWDTERNYRGKGRGMEEVREGERELWRR